MTYPAAKRFATGLLFLMAGIYIAATIWLHTHPALGYVQAFAEAGMVGALADWFAVTALFRRPLGLPIPHTAVIPNNKDRIAETLSQFIVTNFMARDLVAQRLEGSDLALGLAKQMADPTTAEKVADGVVSSLPPLLDTLDDARFSQFLRRALEGQLDEVRIAPLLGGALDILAQQGRHQDLVDAAIVEAWRALAENETAFRTRVRERTGWLWRLAGVDVQASDAIIAALRETLAEIAQKPDHPMRARITEAIARFADDLRQSAATQEKVEAIKAEVLNHPAVVRYLEDLGRHAKQALRAAAEDKTGKLRDSLTRMITSLGETLAQDKDARAAVNTRLRGLIAELAGRHGPDVASLVSDTIKSWDTRTIVEKLEQSVGRDLQYIRINGTLVGGLVGLTIHAATAAFTHG
jgi:uncharacterized membrane-anchored protein YjiN (DUF445 family)